MLGSLVYSQYLPGNSWLHRFDPRCKLGLLGWATFAVFLLRQPSSQFVLAGLIALLPWGSGLTWKLCRPALLGVLPLAVLTLVFQAGWGPAPHGGYLSLPGLEQGGLTALRLLELAWLAHLLALTTSPIAMCDALEWGLRPFGRIGVPYRDLALAFTIAWRFIPILAQEADRLLKAQLSRGAAWDDGSYARRFTTLLGLLTPLLIRCFRYAEDLAVALEARGYGRSLRPTRLHPMVWTLRDSAAWLMVALLVAGLLAAERFLVLPW